MNKKLEEVVVKTVAAFGNGQGGTLLIGVDDAGNVLGLEGDYHALGAADRDKFELHLRNLLNQAFGSAFVTNRIRIGFTDLGELEICKVDVQPSAKPLVVSFKDKNGVAQERLYVRSGNSSQEIKLGEMQGFLAERFGT